MIKQPRPLYMAMLLFVLVIALYYSSLLQVFSSQCVIGLDDQKLMDHLSNHRVRISDFIQPSWQKKYYRPMVDFSFMFDQSLWGGIPFGYRLTNVLIHTFNAILLYFFSRSLFHNASNREEASILSALFFALHPASIESVVWISGRTDPLATFFTLIALLTYISWKKQCRYILFAVTIFSLLAAVFSKEVAIVTPLVIIFYELYFSSNFFNRNRKYILPSIIAFFLLIPIYFVFRFLIITGKDMGLAFIGEGFLQGNLFITIKYVIASYGFYFKKFLYPLPLNFSIYEINIDFYFFIGFISITAISILLLKRKAPVYAFLILWGMAGILPAALISYTEVAWTPWAERYLYYSLVPFSIATGKTLAAFLSLTRERNKYFVLTLAMTPFVLFSALIVYRTTLMNNNEAMWRDSYRKSPTFLGAATAYASTLIQNKKEEEAEKVLREAEKLEGAKHLLNINLGRIYEKKGDYALAEKAYRKALDEARGDSRLVIEGPSLRRKILEALASIYLRMSAEFKNDKLKEKYYLKGIDALKEAYEEEALSFILYKIARLYLIIDNHEMTIKYLKSFIKVSEPDVYKRTANTLLKKLQENAAP